MSDEQVGASDAATSAAQRQQILLGILACPGCRCELDSVDATAIDGAIVDASLTCSTCGTVGVIRSYRPSFLSADLGSGWIPAGLAERTLQRADVSLIGDWDVGDNRWVGVAIGACATATTDASSMAFELGSFPWGGTARVALADTCNDVDLWSTDPGIVRSTLADPESDTGPRRWSLVVAPGENPARQGDQVIVHAIHELVAAEDASPLERRPVNRGNPYPPRFAELLTELPPDAVVVDIGGGDRCHPDPRVLNFEYMKFRAPDFFGDGLALPLRDDSIDLVLSQAVLEHVPRPQDAVDELRRVVKPGGRLYAEFAFMQPLHAVPYHYFNITPHGAALLFERWDVLSTGSFGGLADTLAWFFRILDADARIGVDSTSMIESARRLDATLSPRELDHIASAVFVEASVPR